MITKNSVMLNQHSGPCCALSTLAGNKICEVLTRESPDCNYRCPFYKPEGCGDWIRVEHGRDIYVVPPEEYYQAAKEQEEERKRVPKWKIRKVRTSARSAEQH